MSICKGVHFFKKAIGVGKVVFFEMLHNIHIYKYKASIQHHSRILFQLDLKKKNINHFKICHLARLLAGGSSFDYKS